MSLLPKFIAKYFWGDDLKDLSMSKHKKYIAGTILEKGDVRSVRWLTSKISKKQLKKDYLQKLSPKSRNFWRIFF